MAAPKELTEVERKKVGRQYFEVYAQWFPAQVRDEQLGGIIKRAIEALVAKYPNECDRHAGLFYAACRKVSSDHGDGIGAAVEEFITSAIEADAATARELAEAEAKKALPSVSTAETEKYVEKLLKIQASFVAGRITRGQMLSAMERAMREEGFPEGEIAEVVGAARADAEAKEGGLDSTIAPTSREVAQAALGAINEVNQQRGGDRVEHEGR